MPGAPPPALDSLRRAEVALGEKLLGAVIARLGWSRLTWGLHVEHRVGLAMNHGFPLVVSPAEAELLAACQTPVRQHAERFLITTHGGTAIEDDMEPGFDATIQRFRRYNLAHAATLEEILEIAPLTPGKVNRILEIMDRIVADYAALFADHTDEAARLPARYQELKAAILACLETLGPEELLPPGCDARRSRCSKTRGRSPTSRPCTASSATSTSRASASPFGSSSRTAPPTAPWTWC